MLQAFLWTVCTIGAVGGIVSFSMQIAFYRRIRRDHPDQWRAFPRTDVHPVVGLPVLRFVATGRHRSLPDADARRLGDAILWLQRGLQVLTVVSILVVIWALFWSAA